MDHRVASLLCRRYEPSDRDACLRIFDSNVPDYFAPHERRSFAAFLDRVAVAEPGLEYVVLEDLAHGAIACGGIGVEGSQARLCWGIVERARQRQGIGWFLLLTRLHLAARRTAVTEAALDTIPATAAFFERAGFRAVRTVDDFYGPGLHRRDMVMPLDDARHEWVRARLAEFAARCRMAEGLLTGERA